MKILLDECTPRILRRLLPHRDIATVQHVGGAGVKNGDLLRRAEGQFEILITTDKKLRHQQNFSGRKLALIALPSNNVLVIRQLVGEIDSAISRIRPGEIIEIPLPP